jgi:hypothetical protein
MSDFRDGLNSDVESHAVPAAGRQRREGAKNEREKGQVVAEISQNDFAALRLCVRLNRISRMIVL